MSRKTTSIKAGVLVAALAGTALGVVPAQATTTPQITSVGPAKVATTSTDAILTIRGTNFTDAIKGVRISGCGSGTTAYTDLTVVNATTIRLKKTATCTAGVQTFTLRHAADAAITGHLAFNTAGKTVSFVAPPVISAVTPAGSTAGGGSLQFDATNATTTHGKVVATLNGKNLSVKRVDPDTFTAKVPASQTAGAANLVVTVDGVPSATNTDFTYLTTVKVTPNSTVLDVNALGAAPAPVRVTGVGFVPATDTVEICGASATVINTVARPSTSTALWVQPPAANATGVAITSGDAVGGGSLTGFLPGKVCPVVVKRGSDPLTVVNADSVYAYTLF